MLKKIIHLEVLNFQSDKLLNEVKVAPGRYQFTTPMDLNQPKGLCLRQRNTYEILVIRPLIPGVILCSTSPLFVEDTVLIDEIKYFALFALILFGVV